MKAMHNELSERNELVTSWVDEHGDYLFRYAQRYVRDRVVARDVVQEAFIAVSLTSASFEGRSQPRTWLVSILRNKIRDHFRKKLRQPTDSLDIQSTAFEQQLFARSGHWHPQAAPRAWNESPDVVLERKETFRAVEGCIGKLPDRLREVFLLRELDGEERSAIADALDLSTGNVGVLLHRARLALRQCLERFFVEGKPC